VGRYKLEETTFNPSGGLKAYICGEHSMKKSYQDGNVQTIEKVDRQKERRKVKNIVHINQRDRSVIYLPPRTTPLTFLIMVVFLPGVCPVALLYPCSSK